MRLLPDTHALIWWLADRPRLSTTARSAIADPDNVVFASAATGNASVSCPARSPRICRALFARPRIPGLGLSLEHTLTAGLLHGPHRDPWDRLIMAQAVVDDLTVVTVDPVFKDYGVPVWW
jgi:PIN domain nuclease of toxin-antitoxin system